MRLAPWFVVAVAACVAAPAYADFQYAASTGNAQLEGATETTGTVANASGAPDGVVVTYTADAGGDFLRLRATFTTAVSNPGLILYGLKATGTVNFFEVAWSIDTTYNSFDPECVVFTPTVVPTTTTNVALLTPYDRYDQAGFVPGTFFSVFITFQMSGNSTLTIDAVSNPEPGTLALFALGAAGAAWQVARRRRAAPRARSAS